MANENNRMLMRFEQMLKEINREIINPEIDALSLDGLKPVVEMVARSRAVYLKRLFVLADEHSQSADVPTSDEMAELRALRQTFTDLADASKSVEVAIQRGYLDIKET